MQNSIPLGFKPLDQKNIMLPGLYFNNANEVGPILVFTSLMVKNPGFFKGTVPT